ncbi:hypothetical protein [Saccharopolyspora phatthalungensis]|uniref:Uncharacterized protein n=1 Tax=Saccharopolyspora phatthalungensis TaxID=664693 RepID=A0A840Q859_9PSEU|nr:hypothetical protein [Saccharopolyspora phatthalungensis]MBB5152973.1 hypothetical protein [Saccharopolyspora phatthalungensis]
MTDRPHLIARVRAEFARSEQEKSCHFFPLPEENSLLPSRLRAYCGFAIVPGQAETLDGPAGMPCVHCLLVAALTDSDK